MLRSISFHPQFYLSLGLGVGGIQEFPDNCTNGMQQGSLRPKPWKNTNPKVRCLLLMLKFKQFISFFLLSILLLLGLLLRFPINMSYLYEYIRFAVPVPSELFDVITTKY
jgi:hypothetical protein